MYSHRTRSARLERLGGEGVPGVPPGLGGRCADERGSLDPRAGLCAALHKTHPSEILGRLWRCFRESLVWCGEGHREFPELKQRLLVGRVKKGDMVQ